MVINIHLKANLVLVHENRHDSFFFFFWDTTWWLNLREVMTDFIMSKLRRSCEMVQEDNIYIYIYIFKVSNWQSFLLSMNIAWWYLRKTTWFDPNGLHIWHRVIHISNLALICSSKVMWNREIQSRLNNYAKILHPQN